MKQARWQQEDRDRLPVIDNPTAWQRLLQDCRETETDITNWHIRQLTIPEADWDGLGFVRVWFDRCQFPGLQASQCAFREVWWEDCDLSGGAFRHSRLGDCRFQQGKGVGLVIGDSFFRKTTVHDWNGRYTQWSACSLEQIRWENAQLQEALFADCPLKAVSFAESDLRQAQFFKTYLKGIDLTSCQIDGLSVSDQMTELKGAVVDLYQAADLARMLGIVIR